MKRPNITPGPWHTSHQMHDGFSVAHEIAPNCGKLVALATAHNSGGQAFHGKPLNDEIAKANARAIAALPLLLESLAEILYAHTSPPGAAMGQAKLCSMFAEKAKAALAAAGYEF